MPFSASAITVSGELMSFFMADSCFVAWPRRVRVRAPFFHRATALAMG